ncbi:YndJ family protein [Haloarcula amylovorans]|uniref:YndJ family protein n=1 Tax=Haloarcula amylovorans TaxID=2562280 RepID=UPI001076AAC5|nr:YndJ family protein [Halomicroarcula amylolytica]
MTDGVGRPSVTAVAPRPTLGDIALTDLSAAVGAVAWFALVVAGLLGPVERALALAPLVLVPLGVGMAAQPPFEGFAGRLYAGAVWLQPVGAALFAVSLALPMNGSSAAALAAPWLVVTGLLGLTAADRTLKHTPSDRRLPETSINAGFAYVSVGAVALLLYHLNLTFWFGRTIILLTAIHFHYAGFVLPVMTGLTARALPARTPPFAALVGVILLGPAIIAVGISFSPLIEVVAVGGFTVAVALFGGYVLVRLVPISPPAQGLLLGASVLALPASMALALGYAIATFTSVDVGLDISTMVALHGSLNAFGFGLLGVIGWRLAVPSVRSAD